LELADGTEEQEEEKHLITIEGGQKRRKGVHKEGHKVRGRLHRRRYCAKKDGAVLAYQALRYRGKTNGK